MLSRMAVLTHEYTPRGACLTAFKCRDDEVLLTGPAGTGKSRAALEKLHMVALANPGMRGLMVRKTLVSLTSTALVTWRTFVVPEAVAAGVCEFYGGSQQEPAQYRYANGSCIVIGGMDNPTKIMSSEYDIIYVQEAIELTITDWENLTTRLRNGVVSFQQIIADTNPDVPNHWLKLRCDRGDTTPLESRHTDNPRLYDDDGNPTPAGVTYLAKLDKLTGVRKMRLRDGLWVSAEGMIYEDQWDPTVHIVYNFKVPDDWPRYWAVDFGFNHPFVLQMWARSPDDELYLYREIFRTKRLVEDHAKHALTLVAPEWRPDPSGKLTFPSADQWKEPTPTAIICDHDAEGRATLERYLGMSTIAANKQVIDGIQAVQSRMHVDERGKSRIYICNNALVERDPELEDGLRPGCTTEEIPGYIWDTSNGKKIKEVPLKENDDGCDAMRYMVTHIDLRGIPRVRWV